jgi:CxxC motif-containing protein
VSEENGEITVSGNACKRGEEHGKSEFVNPMRMLTTTVAIGGGTLPRLPVIGSGEVPKAKMGECLKELYALRLKAPVVCGEVVAKDICGTGVDIVASRTMGAVNN